MQAKFILRRPDDSRAQLAITADATATVAELAQALAAGDPDQRQPPPGTGLTLRSNTPPSTAARPDGCWIRHAASPIRVCSRGRRSASRRRRRSPTAAGGAAPRPSPASSTAPTRDLNFLCRRVTHLWARASPTTSPSPTTGSPTSTRRSPSGRASRSSTWPGRRGLHRRPAGATRDRGAGDVVQLAATSLAILPTLRPGTTQTDSVAIEFNRSPRVVARFDEHEFTAPRPPQPPNRPASPSSRYSRH